MHRSVLVQFVDSSPEVEKPVSDVTIWDGFFRFLSAACLSAGAPRSNPRRDHCLGSLLICGAQGDNPTNRCPSSRQARKG